MNHLRLVLALIALLATKLAFSQTVSDTTPNPCELSLDVSIMEMTYGGSNPGNIFMGSQEGFSRMDDVYNLLKIELEKLNYTVVKYDPRVPVTSKSQIKIVLGDDKDDPESYFVDVHIPSYGNNDFKVTCKRDWQLGRKDGVLWPTAEIIRERVTRGDVIDTRIPYCDPHPTRLK